MVDITTIIFSVIGAIILGIIAFYILKHMKGSVKIKLDKTSFSSGENVSGIIYLKAKKEIESNRLFIELVAKRQEKRRKSDGTTSTTWRKIYSQEVNLEDKKNYPAGYINEYNFKIKVPTNKEMGRFTSGNNIVDSAVKFASSVMGVNRLKWSVHVRLDASGLDLTNSKKVYVNLSNGNNLMAPTTA